MEENKMLQQSSQLKGVVPRSHVDGFSVDILRHNDFIVRDAQHEDFVIDYYFEVTVFCDGTNSEFKEKGYFAIHISQLLYDCIAEFETNCPVVMLKPYEQLLAVEVLRGEMNDLRGVWLSLSIRNYQTNEDYVQGFLFREE
jgi:hypothetical protein